MSNKYYSWTVFLEFSSWSVLWILVIFLTRDITYALENEQYNIFINIILKYSGAFLVLMCFSFYIKNYGWVRYLESLRKTLYETYIPEFIGLDNASVERYGTGKIVHLLQNGIHAHALMLNDVLYNIAKILPFLLFTLYFVFQIGNILGVAFIFLYIALLFYVKYFDDKQVQIRQKKHYMKRDISRGVVKVIMSKTEILQGEKHFREVKVINSIHDNIIDNNIKQNIWGTILFRGFESILFFSKIFLLIYIGGQFYAGEVSLTYVVTFLTVALYFEKNGQDFLIFYKNFTRDIHDLTGLWDFFDTTPKIEGYSDGEDFICKKGNIKLQNISYEYEEGKAVFQDFSLDVKGGKVTALVGPSGGGKTTLVKLISGYIRANSGDIIIDNQKLSQIALKSYYQNIGYLTQEPSVFDGSVRENLMYSVTHSIRSSTTFPSGEGKDKESVPLQFEGEMSEGQRGCKKEEVVSDEKLHEVITLANCEFIYDLPNGIDTEIGERGVRLSGGQKQRLAIAKIFLKDPKIIILDEPTSALDSISEKKITDAMHNLFIGRTVIIVAHRLQTVKHADEIIVIENGEIKERGKHTVLLKKKGYYKEMLDLQSGF